MHASGSDAPKPQNQGAQTNKTFAIYTGENVASGEPALRIKDAFNDVAIKMVSGQSIQSEEALDDQTIALFLPGIMGDHSPYSKELGRIGNEKIRDYVENGGVFIGGCAGAYYACSDILYDPPWLDQPKTSQPGLDFFNGLARGPLPNLAKETGSPDWFEDCTHTEIEFDLNTGAKRKTNIIYGNGPMLFPDTQEEAEQINVIARYTSVAGEPIAIASKRVGKGLAIFLGVLPYYGADLYGDTEIDDSTEYNRFINSIKPFENEREDIWNFIVALINDHHEQKEADQSLGSGPEKLGKKPQI